jgi:hypothetical protein
LELVSCLWLKIADNVTTVPEASDIIARNTADLFCQGAD